MRRRVDFLVASNHWGLDHEVLDYQREIGRAAIDAGADLVMGHGPHHPLGIELYKDKPIFYSLGSFSFETGHRARKHPDWIGLMVRLALDGGALQKVAFSFVRHNEKNETIARPLAGEQDELRHMREMSERFGTSLRPSGDQVVVWSKS